MLALGHRVKILRHTPGGIEDPAAFYFYENWETAEQLDAHRETPHMTEFAAVLDDLLDESGLTVHRARRIGVAGP